jgi:hypothetical protein
MTDLELIFSILGEASTKKVTIRACSRKISYNKRMKITKEAV